MSTVAPDGSVFDRSSYDARPTLSDDERADLVRIDACRLFRQTTERERLAWRLYVPVRDALAHGGASRVERTVAWGAFVDHMLALDRPFFGWSAADWEALVGPGGPCERRKLSRACALSVGYLCCDFRGFVAFTRATAYTTPVAERVFGADAVVAADERVRGLLEGAGYPSRHPVYLRRAVSLVLLRAGSPRLDDVTLGDLDAAYVEGDPSESARRAVYRVSRALELAGLTPRAARIPSRSRPVEKTGVAPEWAEWCDRWQATSPRLAKTRDNLHSTVLRVGLWLAERLPEVRSPADWTAATCLDFVATVSEARVGQYVFARVGRAAATRGKPMTAKAKSGLLYAVRSFFVDLQQWGWIETRFAPHVALGLPSAIRRLLGPSPRDVDEVTWLKLVWASLNLAPEDLPASGATGGAVYPFELVRAAAVLWTHAGLRANEITRLRCGCVRAQEGEITDDESGRHFPEGSVCLVEVPYNKTSAPFSKPVAGAVREAVLAWEAVRPEQPRRVDPKTGHPTDFLLSYKGRRITRSYLNRSLIPTLCRKAGVPTEDSRGPITSHRGRSSAVTMLANARQGMSLVELMAWCGHRSPASTMHYLRVRPARLTEAYARADEAAYLVGVLVDAEAVRDGSAAEGAPWKYYDLGSSYCTHAFWSTCAHRLACAGCAFNVPKASSRGQALEAKASLERYLERVPLTADERSAVEGDLSKLDELLGKLAGVPAPDGETVGGQIGGDGAGEGRPEVTPLIPLPVLPATPGTDPT